VTDKLAETSYPVHPLVAARWSPRAFDARSVPLELLGSLLEAARWAPSSGNEQPWRFVVARREDTEAFARLASCLVPGNQRWAPAAPVLVLTSACLQFERTGAPNRHALHDTGLALANLLLEATARGLAAHPMAGFDVEAARAAAGVPADFEPVAMVAIGYRGAAESLPEDLRAREVAPRRRRPLRDLAFAGTWNTPLGI